MAVSPRKTNSRHGVTLIEAIASIAVLAILGSLASTLIFTAADGYLSASTASRLHGEAGLALERAVHELRSVERREYPSGSGPALENLTTDAITWHETEQLRRQGEQLILRRDEIDHVLAEHLTHFQVRAFDDENQPMSADLTGDEVAGVHRIELTLTLEKHGARVTVRTRVFPRGLLIASGAGP